MTISLIKRQAANFLTTLRLGFAVAAVALAADAAIAARAAAAALVVAAVLLDWADGWVARRCDAATPFGALYDILVDRVAECLWWITLAVLQVVPLWIPLAVVSRGFVVDALRSLAYARGLSAFGERSMMRSRWGRALVASRTSRAAYGILKAVAFGWLFAFHAALPARGVFASWLPAAHAVSLALAVLVAVFCLVRGLPVVLESRRLVSRA